MSKTLEAAIALHELKESYLAADFTHEEAMHLVLAFLAFSLQSGQAQTEDPDQ